MSDTISLNNDYQYQCWRQMRRAYLAEEQLKKEERVAHKREIGQIDLECKCLALPFFNLPYSCTPGRLWAVQKSFSKLVNKVVPGSDLVSGIDTDEDIVSLKKMLQQ